MMLQLMVSTIDDRAQYDNQAGTLNLLAQGTFTTVVADDRDELGVKTLDLLVNLKVPTKQQAKLQLAIEHVQGAIVRAQESRADAAYSITQLLAAYGLLAQIPEAPAEVLVSVGRLLGAYQALWSSSPP